MIPPESAPRSGSSLLPSPPGLLGLLDPVMLPGGDTSVAVVWLPSQVLPPSTTLDPPVQGGIQLPLAAEGGHQQVGDELPAVDRMA